MIDHFNSAVWEDFFKYVRPDVHGCPVAMVKEALRNACIEFVRSLLFGSKRFIVEILLRMNLSMVSIS